MATITKEAATKIPSKYNYKYRILLVFTYKKDSFIDKSFSKWFNLFKFE